MSRDQFPTKESPLDLTGNCAVRLARVKEKATPAQCTPPHGRHRRIFENFFFEYITVLQVSAYSS